MTRPLTIAEARAQGILPSGNSPKTTGKAPPSSVHPTPAPRTPEEEPKPATVNNEQKKLDAAERKRDAVLRPFFQVATHQGYVGKRVVFVGLTQSQVDHLRAAAVAAGIPEQI